VEQNKKKNNIAIQLPKV